MYNPQIETFITVATLGSFSKAAEALFISPTAIMKQINSLEERLELTLFVRNNHGLSLTEAGKSFLQDSKYLIEYSNRAIEKARTIYQKENIKSIRIGTSFMTPVKFLLDVWTELQVSLSQLNIELIPFENTPENAREILRNLGQQIDIVAGIYDEYLRLNNNFCVQHICNKKVSLAVPLTNPLSKKEILDIKDLEKSGVLLVAKGWGEHIDIIRADLIENGIKVYDFDFFNIKAFNRAAKENVPIMAIDGWENIHPLLKIIPVNWNHTIPFGIMYSPNPTNTVKQFIKAISVMQQE